jgi:hypothetical protein
LHEIQTIFNLVFNQTKNNVLLFDFGETPLCPITSTSRFSCFIKMFEGCLWLFKYYKSRVGGGFNVEVVFESSLEVVAKTMLILSITSKWLTKKKCFII